MGGHEQATAPSPSWTYPRLVGLHGGIAQFEDVRAEWAPGGLLNENQIRRYLDEDPVPDYFKATALQSYTVGLMQGLGDRWKNAAQSWNKGISKGALSTAEIFFTELTNFIGLHQPGKLVPHRGTQAGQDAGAKDDEQNYLFDLSRWDWEFPEKAQPDDSSGDYKGWKLLESRFQVRQTSYEVMRTIGTDLGARTDLGSEVGAVGLRRRFHSWLASEHGRYDREWGAGTEERLAGPSGDSWDKLMDGTGTIEKTGDMREAAPWAFGGAYAAYLAVLPPQATQDRACTTLCGSVAEAIDALRGLVLAYRKSTLNVIVARLVFILNAIAAFQDLARYHENGFLRFIGIARSILTGDWISAGMSSIDAMLDRPSKDAILRRFASNYWSFSNTSRDWTAARAALIDKQYVVVHTLNTMLDDMRAMPRAFQRGSGVDPPTFFWRDWTEVEYGQREYERLSGRRHELGDYDDDALPYAGSASGSPTMADLTQRFRYAHSVFDPTAHRRMRELFDAYLNAEGKPAAERKQPASATPQP
ncbi:MAG TPA: hypothetical protein VH561_12955 [Micromonosporaceae bacterium]|jgi:hypothetical protein